MVEIFDPNCPHCAALGASLDEVIAENGEAAEFFYHPYPLRQESVGQVVALYAAQEEGKFLELKEEMFRRQDSSWGMTLPELLSTVEAVGMDAAAFEQTITNQETLQPYLDAIQGARGCRGRSVRIARWRPQRAQAGDQRAGGGANQLLVQPALPG